MDKVMDAILTRMQPKIKMPGLSLLAKMVMGDKLPAFSDGIYVFAETKDNETSSFAAVAELVKKDAASEVFIANAGGAGAPGFSHSAERLGNYVSEGRIRPLSFPNPKTGESWVNTYTESVALVRFAQASGRKSWVVVAPPFHIIRAYMTAASASIRHGGSVNFYAQPGISQDWKQYVHHSQGEGPYPRWKWLTMEIERIKQYSVKGDIAPLSDIISYMENRA